jgi:hypothetical protein
MDGVRSPVLVPTAGCDTDPRAPRATVSTERMTRARPPATGFRVVSTTHPRAPRCAIAAIALARGVETRGPPRMYAPRRDPRAHPGRPCRPGARRTPARWPRDPALCPPRTHDRVHRPHSLSRVVSRQERGLMTRYEMTRNEMIRHQVTRYQVTCYKMTRHRVTRYQVTCYQVTRHRVTRYQVTCYQVTR